MAGDMSTQDAIQGVHHERVTEGDFVLLYCPESSGYLYCAPCRYSRWNYILVNVRVRIIHLCMYVIYIHGYILHKK